MANSRSCAAHSNDPAALEVEPPDLVTLAPCRLLVVRCPVAVPPGATACCECLFHSRLRQSNGAAGRGGRRATRVGRRVIQARPNAGRGAQPRRTAAGVEGARGRPSPAGVVSNNALNLLDLNNISVLSLILSGAPFFKRPYGLGRRRGERIAASGSCRNSPDYSSCASHSCWTDSHQFPTFHDPQAPRPLSASSPA